MNDEQEIFIVNWDNDGIPNCQAYVSVEAALRDFPEAGVGSYDGYHGERAVFILPSTVQA